LWTRKNVSPFSSQFPPQTADFSTVLFHVPQIFKSNAKFNKLE
jgi:hypothetical protein